MMLASYIKHQSEQNIPLSGAVFHEEVGNLYEDATKDAKKQSLFALSDRWLRSFVCHYSFCNFKMTDNPTAASCAVRELPSLFKVTIVEGGYTVRQVFNLDELHLLWKHVAIYSFISINQTMAGNATHCCSWYFIHRNCGH
jgi:hypothetical protein